MGLKLQYGIPVRNEALNIVSLLKSIMEQTIPPEKIIICVNGSTDATYDIAVIQAEKNDLIEVIRSDPAKPTPGARSLNKFRLIKFCFGDGDVFIDHEAAERLLRCLDSDPELIHCRWHRLDNQPETNLFREIFCRG